MHKRFWHGLPIWNLGFGIRNFIIGTVKSSPLAELDNVSVTFSSQCALDRISWRLCAGEHWAVLGANGSGKSTLLKLIRGDIWPDPDRVGRRTYALARGASASPVGWRERVAMVSPELQDRYLQQEWTLTGERVVQSGYFHTDYLHQRLSVAQRARALALMEQLGVEHLRRRNVQQISQGELRRVLIARALVGRPRVLILDEFCDGLDAVTRRQLLEVVERIARNGTQVLYTTHRAGELIPAVSHVAVLKNGRIAWQGPRNEWQGGLLGESRAGRVAALLSPRPGAKRRGVKSVASSRNPSLDTPLGDGDGAARRHHPRSDGDKSPQSTFLFRLREASVFLGRKRVLCSLDWRMSGDENWAILGRNGAGKSTFLSLLSGDVHPAVGGRVERFAGEPRTLWQVRRRLGYVSGHLQANYRAKETGVEVITSGFFSSVGLVDRPTRAQQARVRELIERFQLGAFARQHVTEMSYGQLRRVLMARALVHRPRVLIFDEPFDGLDAASKAELQRSLEQASSDGTRLVIVTHHLEDLPRCITHALVLERGRITTAGSLADARLLRRVGRLFACGTNEG